MQRVVSVWLPQFPIERLRRTLRVRPGRRRSGPGDAGQVERPAAPFALVEGRTQGLRIAAVNQAAAVGGVVPGQSLADARAMLPGLLTRPAERARDAAALAALARWAERYGPLRNTEGADGLWIDVSGVADLFGGEAALAEDCRRQLAAAGFTARLGLADTAAAAFALARYGPAGAPVRIAAAGETRAALAGLPVEALRLAPATVVLLRRLGLFRIGDLYPLPRAGLARRFRDLGRTLGGEDGAQLACSVVLRLDQALGAIRDPRRPLAPAPCRLVRRVFAEPLISSAGIEAAVTAALDGLCGELAAAGEGARRLELALYRSDGSRAALAVGTSTATRAPAHLARLLAEKLAAVDLGFGVDVVTLAATAVEPLAAVQAGLGARPQGDGGRGLAELVDRLAVRLGAAATYRLAPCPVHQPEAADVVLPPLASAADDGGGGPMALRPPLLLPRPEPIEVVAGVPEGPPRRFRWRRAGHRVVKAEGPERIEPAWWRSIGSASGGGRPRDYYRIEDDHGGRYWVFREGLYGRDADDAAPAWYVHGLFG